LRQHHGTRECHRRYGLWIWEPIIPRHRVGQDESYGGRCSTGHPATLAPLTLIRSTSQISMLKAAPMLRSALLGATTSIDLFWSTCKHFSVTKDKNVVYLRCENYVIYDARGG